jgi:hypothetical protein
MEIKPGQTLRDKDGKEFTVKKICDYKGKCYRDSKRPCVLSDEGKKYGSYGPLRNHCPVYHLMSSDADTFESCSYRENYEGKVNIGDTVHDVKGNKFLILLMCKNICTHRGKDGLNPCVFSGEKYYMNSRDKNGKSSWTVHNRDFRDFTECFFAEDIIYGEE